MRNCLYITLFLASIICTESNAQSRFFIVKNASFSSRISNEFSPVYYNDGIVFCSDRSDNSIVAYRDGISRLFKIFYTRKKISSGWEIPRILSKEITSGFNDGPVTFNEKMNIIYYSRNNSIKNSMRNIADTSNKLGIYSAELIGGIWTNIKPLNIMIRDILLVHPHFPRMEKEYILHQICPVVWAEWTSIIVTGATATGFSR